MKVEDGNCGGGTSEEVEANAGKRRCPAPLEDHCCRGGSTKEGCYGLIIAVGGCEYSC